MPKFKQILSFLLAILIFVSNFSFFYVNNFVVEAAGKAQYIGKTVLDQGFLRFYARENRDGGEEFPAYCWDREAARPNDTEYFTEVEPGYFKDYHKKSHIVEKNGEYFADPITTKILYNGYHIDAAGIKKAYGISDADFHIATQMALWAIQSPIDGDYGYLLNNNLIRPTTRERGRKIFYVANMLIKGVAHKKSSNDTYGTVLAFEDDQVGDSIVLQDPPEDFRVKIFHPRRAPAENFDDTRGEPLEIQRLAIMEFTSKPVINFVKVDKHDKPVAHATFELLKDDAPILNWESDGLPKRLQLEETDDNEPRVYVIREKQAPVGYDKADDIKIKIRKTQNGRYVISKFEQGVWGPETGIGFNYTVKMVNQNQSGQVSFKKVSFAENAPLSGASFEIYVKGKPNTKVAKFETKDNGESEVVTLEKGTEYILKEIKVPSSKYKKMDDVHFSFNADGSLALVGDAREDVEIQANQLILKNKIIDEPFIEIKKVDNFGKPLSGAKMDIERDVEIFNRTRGTSDVSDDPEKANDIVSKSIQFANFRTEEVNGRPGLYLEVVMNPSGEEHKTVRPWFFISVPKGLSVHEIFVNGYSYTKDTWGNGVSRFYSSRENGKFLSDFNKHILENYDPGRLMEAKDVTDALIMNWESRAVNNGRFSVKFIIDDLKTFDELNIYKMLVGYNVEGTALGWWNRTKLLTFVLPTYKEFTTTEKSETLILSNLEKHVDTTLSITELEPPAGYKNNNLKLKVEVNAADKLIKDFNLDNYPDTEPDKQQLKDSQKYIMRNPENPNEFIFRNEKGDEQKVKFLKKSSDGRILSGTEFSLTNIFKREIESLATTNEPTELSLIPGKYFLNEIRGYLGHKNLTEEIAFEVYEDGSLAVVEDPENVASVENNNTLVVTNNKTEHTIYFNKKGIDGQNLPNVEFSLTGRTGSIVTANGPYETTLKPGDYILTETSAPEGYKLTQPIKFRVLDNGKLEILEKSEQDLVSVSPTSPNQLDIVNQLADKDIQISKVDVHNIGIKGARINILAKDSKEVVATWLTKDGETSKTIKLSPGTYIFNEISAPAGFDRVADFEFTITENGQIQKNVQDDIARVNGNTLVVIDQSTLPMIYISKEKVSGEHLAGASLKILNAEGTAPATVYDMNHLPIIDATWTSSATEHKIIYLAPGNYKLREEQAPENYVKVQDIDFSVDDHGRITLKKVAESDVVRVDNESELAVVNSVANTKKVKFSKRNLAGSEIAGAGIQITKGQETVAFWISEADKTHELLLEAGTYHFRETFAPEGYTKITEFDFTVADSGSVAITGNVEGASYVDGKLVITNKPKEITPDQGGNNFSFLKKNSQNEAISNAVLQIYKVDNKTEKLVAQWVSLQDAKTFALPDGEYIFKEKEAPNGYYLVRDIRFTVTGSAMSITNESSLKPNSVRLESNNATLVAIDESKEKSIIIQKITKDNNPLAGAVFELYEKEEQGREVRSFTSANDDGKSFSLKAGTYILKEKQAPENYQRLPLVQFTLSKDGAITDLLQLDEAGTTSPLPIIADTGKAIVYVEGNKLFAINEQVQTFPVKFNKQALKGTSISGLASARLQIKQDDKVVHEWTTNKDNLEVVNLPAGTYTFHEEQAPITYHKIPDFNFTVSDTGEITIIGNVDPVSVVLNAADKEFSILDDNSFTIHLKKRDIADFSTENNSTDMDDYDQNFAILNAKFKLEQYNARTTKWEVIGENNQTVNGYLTYNNLTYGKYRLTEQQAPEHYQNIESFSFEIKHTRDLTNATTGITLDPDNQSTDDNKFRIFFNKNNRTDLVVIVGNELTKNLRPEGELRTTVVAANKKASVASPALLESSELAEQGISVVDEITYNGLVPNKKYQVTATLMHIPRDGSKPTAVANVTKTEIKRSSVTGSADETSPDKWIIDFGMVKGLVVGEKYVVYEVAESLDNLVDSTPDDGNDLADAKHTLTHEDPTDKSQTFVIKTPLDKPVDGTDPDKIKGELKTTVIANEQESNSENSVRLESSAVSIEAQGVKVVDKIFYKDLAPNQDYKVTATLMEIKGNSEPPTAVANATQVVELRSSLSGEGEWLIDFGKLTQLQKDKHYVVYEKAESLYNIVDSTDDNVVNPDSKHIVKHEDPQDKAQTFVIRPDEPENPIDGTDSENIKGTLRTTVIVGSDLVNDEIENKSEASALEVASVAASLVELPEGVVVKDTIVYTDLAPNKYYRVTAKLMHINKDKTIEPLAVATKVLEEVRTSPEGTGQWSVIFDKVKGLMPDETYVVYEVAESLDNLVDTTADNVANPDSKHIVKHEDPTDKAQTFVVRPKTPENPIDGTNGKNQGTLRTTVGIGTIQSGNDEEAIITSDAAKKGVDVVDTVTYKNLASDQLYSLKAILIHIKKDGTLEEVVTTSELKRVEKSGNGVWQITFKNQKDLKSGEKYVVYEEATSEDNLVDTTGDNIADSKHIVIHKDPSDKAQIFVVEGDDKDDISKGKLRTTVSVDKISSTASAPVRILAENLDQGIDVVDTIDYINLKPNEQYDVTASLMHIKKDGTIEAVPNAVKKETFTSDASGNGQWTITLEKVKGLISNEKYVVYEQAISRNLLVTGEGSDKPNETHQVYHKDPSDRAQTFVVRPQTPTEVIDGTDSNNTKGELKTTVIADGTAATEDKEVRLESNIVDKSIQVVDTINYKNLVPNHEYKITTTLMHIVKDELSHKITATKLREQETIERVSETGEGVFTVFFDKVTGLEVGEKYVIYEVAESLDNLVDTTGDKKADSKHLVIHKDPNDRAQTFVVRNPAPPEPIDGSDGKEQGELRTTVVADNLESSTTESAIVAKINQKDGIIVKDKIYYSNLVPKQTYTVTASLMHITSEGIVEEQPVAVIEEDFTSNETGDGIWEIRFAKLDNLVAGEKYVVYEEAISRDFLIDVDNDKVADKPHIVTHKDPSDKAQTFLLEANEENRQRGSLKTTVQVGTEKAGETEAAIMATEAANPITVTDTIYYVNLIPNEEYMVTASLMHIKKDGTVSLLANATASQKFTASQSGSGQWSISIANVRGLVPGEKYVVYEEALSLKPLVDTNNDQQPDELHKVEHKDPFDKAQTFIVSTEVPEKPIDESEGKKQGTLKTTVSANDITADDTKYARILPIDLAQGVRVVDKIVYTDLAPNQFYRVTARLMKINSKGEAEEVPNATIRQIMLSSTLGSGSWIMNFGYVKGLQAGEKYVVFESAESINKIVDSTGDKIFDKKHIIEHENPKDEAQTFVIANIDPFNPTNPSTENPFDPNNPKDSQPKTGVRLVDVYIED